MPKKLEITDRIKNAIIKSTGDAEFDTSKVSVFETLCLNTLPINKRGLFSKAVTTEATLAEMAAFVKNGGFVPMHTLHEQGYQLPIGRVFDADVTQNERGLPELRALFFIGNEHDMHVAGVDNGSIEEVSVGLATKHLNCSVCGFDYLGAEAGPDNIYGYVCNDGHEIGVDGTHLILSGMSRWLETSLVSLGAANNAKILSRTKSLLGAESYEKLAASGISPEATVLYATSPLTSKKSESKMDIKELMQLNASLSGEKAVAEHKIVNLTAQVAELTSTKATLETELNTVKAALSASQTLDAANLAKEVKAANESLAAQLAYTRREADRLCVAAGVATLSDTATFAELIASIDANRVKLSDMFNGNANGANAGAGDQVKTGSPSSFKISK